MLDFFMVVVERDLLSLKVSLLRKYCMCFDHSSDKGNLALGRTRRLILYRPSKKKKKKKPTKKAPKTTRKVTKTTTKLRNTKGQFIFILNNNNYL